MTETAKYQAKIRRQSEFTRILVDWADHYVQLTLSTGEKVTGAISVNHDFTMVFIGIETDDESIYRIENVIGVKYLGEDPPSDESV